MWRASRIRKRPFFASSAVKGSAAAAAASCSSATTTTTTTTTIEKSVAAVHHPRRSSSSSSSYRRVIKNNGPPLHQQQQRRRPQVVDDWRRKVGSLSSSIIPQQTTTTTHHHHHEHVTGNTNRHHNNNNTQNESDHQWAIKSLMSALQAQQTLVRQPDNNAFSLHLWLQRFEKLGNSRVLTAAAATKTNELEPSSANDDLGKANDAVPQNSGPHQVPLEIEPFKEAKAFTTTEIKAESTVVNNKSVSSKEDALLRQQDNSYDPLNMSALVNSIRRKDAKVAMNVFRFMVRTNKKAAVVKSLHPGIVRGLFDLAIRKKRTCDAYAVLSFYKELTQPKIQPNGIGIGGDLNDYAEMYKKLADCLRFLGTDTGESPSPQTIEFTVRSLMVDVQKLDRAAQERIYPVLVTSLIRQKWVPAGKFAKAVYEQMVQKGICSSLPDNYWAILLSMSKFSRQQDLPYVEILKRAVDLGQRPYPPVVVNALENLFPYENSRDTYAALQAILELERSASDDENERHYVIDLSTLETIGASAAKVGFVDLNLLIWDLVDVFGHQASLSIYENTAMAFSVNGVDSYPNMFSILAEMEAKGWEPSRALIRSLSAQFSPSTQNLDLAMKHLKNLRSSGTRVTVASLNVITSAGAERGDIDRTMAMLEEFEHNNIEPNADTFSFCFEAIWKNLDRRTRKVPTEEFIVSCLSEADNLLTMMEEKDISPSHHVIRDYVELLCRTSEVETATGLVYEALGNNSFVNNKTLYRTAMANLNIQNIDEARKLANFTSEPLPFLMNAIEAAECAAQENT